VNDPATEQSRMGRSDPVRAWLWRLRSSTRVAFFLRSVCLLLSAVLSLFWARTFVRALGEPDYGLLLTFLAVAQLGGLGDLGISGAIGVRMMQFLATDKNDAGREFLATARGVSYLLAAIVGGGFILLSPWLPYWLHLTGTASAGSLPLLFVMGGIGAGLLIVSGFFQSLNYARGNVVWPIVPLFLLVQVAFCTQWALISIGAPLWLQYTPHLVSAALSAALIVLFVRVSHPWLGHLRPVSCSPPIVKDLLTSSFWAYLMSLGTLIYFSSDQIVVNAGFGSATVPSYRFNYKLCEMSVMLLASATFVALPAIMQRLLSDDPQQRLHGLDGLDRLQRLQCFAGTAAALVYLGVNETFLNVWLGPGFDQSIALQGAFALNLALTMAGDAIVQTRGRMNSQGLKIVGLTVGGCGLLNLGLSLIAMKYGSLVGVASATVIAQLVQMTVLTRSTSIVLGLPLAKWIIRATLLPLISVLLASLIRQHAEPRSLAGALSYALACLVVLGGVSIILKLKPALLFEEWKRLRAECR
jgi:O-antigen/teichoic acid export membrane protein